MSTHNLSPPALVLGTGLTALGVVRSLARAGIPALCLSGGAEFEARSRWYRAHTDRIDAWAPASELVALLQRSALGGGVLFACSDHWAVEITRLPADTAARFRTCAPATDVMVSLIDKSRFRDRLVATGVPHPYTEPVPSESRLEQLMADAPAGVFLKPTDSQRFVKLFGRKAFLVSGVDSARDCYRRARGEGIDLVLQEYIPGGADQHYFVDGFVGRDHRVLAGFARRRVRMHPPVFGNSSCMTSIDTSAVSPAIDALTDLFSNAGYRGIFSAEFKLDERDGVFKLLEVNCRPWWYIEFCARCGVNVAEMAYRDAMDEEIPLPSRYRKGVELVYGYYDLQAFRRMSREGSANAFSFARSWTTGDHAIFTWDDPYPAVWNFQRRLGGWVAKRMRPGAKESA